MAKDFEWPYAERVRESQRKHSESKPEQSAVRDGLIMVDEKTWVPEKDAELQLSIIIASHCGSAGHRGGEAAADKIGEIFVWDGLESDCREFVAACIHCIISRAGKKVPRPMAITVHGTRPNEVVHFDYHYCGIGVDDLKYTLLIRDDLETYVWLWPCKSADADTAAEALGKWIATFRRMEIRVSDQGSHFKNRVMKLLAEDFAIKHQFVFAYSPWENGTVESCMREVLRTFRALLSEMQLAPKDWPNIINMVQVILNEAPPRLLGKNADGTVRSPLEVMTGLKPARYPLRIFPRKPCAKEPVTLTRARALKVMGIERMQHAREGVHRKVSDRVTSQRKKQIESHNRQKNIVSVNFAEGDFVLVRRAQEKGHKLRFRWTGPRRVTKVLSELVYEVTSLVEGSSETVHAARLLH